MAARIKSLEASFEKSLNGNEPYVVRLDGVGFRRLTEGLTKPFDGRFTRAMLKTTRDLLERCSARTAYCMSDEISLLFGPEPSPNQIIYAGRTFKIVSVMAAAAAARFNYHMSRMDWTDLPQSVANLVTGHGALFDARVFSLPDDIMAMEAIYWRHAFDGRRNAIGMVGSAHFPHEETMGVSLAELTVRLKKKFGGVDVHEKYAPAHMYGAFMKKRQYQHMGFNPITGQAVPTLRAKVEARTFDWTLATDPLRRTEMALAKYWEEEHPASLEQLLLDD